jgi:hypothetical protein
MKIRVKTPDKMIVEWFNGSWYYIYPNVLCNRLNDMNLDNLGEPQRTYVKDAMKAIRTRIEKIKGRSLI